MSTLISALLDAIFASLAEATGLSDWLRQRLGRDPERLAFGAALAQALTDVANEFPGRDLRYFTEMLPQFAGPLLARYLQPAASLPTADELTHRWLNHLTIDSAIVYRQEFAVFATRFLARLAFHLDNQEPLQWIVQARRQRSSESATHRMATAAEQSAVGVAALRQELAVLSTTLETALQANKHSSVFTSGGMYVDGDVRAQNFAGRDLTIKNYFVQGLPRLVIDYSSRIQDFLLEYLGSKRKRVPFGGRQQQLAELDAWLDDPIAPPYYLMSAEAGRGKSALVCRWLAQLTTRSDLEVIFIPISIRFETATQDVVFAALAARLAKFYGEDGQLDLRSSAEQWKATSQIYLRRTPPEGKRLLVILDGLDEATGWMPTRSLFSADPPDGLRILVMARIRPGEHGVGSWVNTLGWDNPQVARLAMLLPLERRGVEEALLSMGNPLDKLATKVDVVGELHRISEGDPLLVRLYVDALVAERQKVHQLEAQDLQDIQPGLAGYFERWWADQQEQWRLVGQDPIVEQANLRTLLNAIAASLGPLMLDDLAALHPDLADSMLVRRLVGAVSRWLVGNGHTQGYSYSHPRMGYYFWDNLGKHERRAWDGRFCIWGKRVLVELNSEILKPTDTPYYLLQHYAAHLERSGAPADAFYLMISNGWREAWSMVDISYTGFLNDLEVVWKKAQLGYKPGQPGHAVAMVQQIRAALCCVSIVTLNLKTPPELLVQLIHADLQTLTQALAIVKLGNKDSRILFALVTRLPIELFRGVLITVFGIFHSEHFHIDALRQLVSRLPSTMIEEALACIHQLRSEKDQADLLCLLVPHLTPAQITTTFFLVRSLHFKVNSDGLRLLFRYLPQQFFKEILDYTILVNDEYRRYEILILLAPHVPNDLLNHALTLAQLLNERMFTDVLIALQPQFQANLINQVTHLAQKVHNERDRRRILRVFAPYLAPVELLHETLKSIQDNDTKEFQLLVQHLNVENLSEVLGAVHTIKNEFVKAEMLIALIPCLPDSQRSQAIFDTLAIIENSEYVTTQLDLLSIMLPHLQDSIRDQFLDKFLEKAGIADYLYLGLIRLIPWISKIDMSKSKRMGIYDKTLKGISTITNEQTRANTLGSIISYLPIDFRDKAFRLACLITDEEVKADILVKMAPYFLPTVLKEALLVAQKFISKQYRVYLLSELAAYLPADERSIVLNAVLADIRLIEDTKYSKFVLNTLSYYLPANDISVQTDCDAIEIVFEDDPHFFTKNEKGPPLPIGNVKDALVSAYIMDEAYRADMLKYLARHLVYWTQREPRQTFMLFVDCLIASTMKSRPELLRDIASLMPFILALAGDEAPQAAEDIYHAIQEVCDWWP